MANIRGSKRGPYKHHQPPRQCQFPGCKNIFTPINSNQKFCTADHYRKCWVCGKLYKARHPSSKIDTSKTCSKECSKLLQERTILERYGVKHPLQNEKILAKSQHTLRTHYGVDTPAESPILRQRRVENCMKKYGVEHPMKLQSTKDKIRNTVQLKYGVDWSCQTPQCRNAGNPISRANRKFATILRDKGIPVEFEYSIESFCYDLHVLNTNVLIEINPTITHNTVFNPYGNPIDKFYHKRKSEVAEKHGYICIHIFDWMKFEDVIHNLLWSTHFKTDVSDVRVHMYNMTTNDCIHLLDDSLVDTYIQLGYYPLYDDGYNLEYIFNFNNKKESE